MRGSFTHDLLSGIFRTHPLARKFEVPVDFSAYKEWRLQHKCPSAQTGAPALNGVSSIETKVNESMASTTPSTDPPAPYPSTFSQIVDLITTGQPVPGIKDIPDTVLAGQETQSTTAKRKKPWEKDSAISEEEKQGSAIA